MIALGQVSPSVVIAPCHRADGTNALFLRPPDLLEFSFGAGSFEKHQQAADQIGIIPQIYCSPTVALDLDIPEDLKDLDFKLRQNEMPFWQ
jgi:2-phospho-L-lactate guanylyltransferase (CobY/MobA/RfbA family)